VWMHHTPTYEVLTERDFKGMCTCVCVCGFTMCSLTGLALTGSLKMFGTMEGCSYWSLFLPELTIQLKWEGTTIRSTILDESFRQFRFDNLEPDKTYTVHIGMAI
jgi:hypothetical protein